MEIRNADEKYDSIHIANCETPLFELSDNSIIEMYLRKTTKEEKLLSNAFITNAVISPQRIA